MDSDWLSMNHRRCGLGRLDDKPTLENSVEAPLVVIGLGKTNAWNNPYVQSCFSVWTRNWSSLVTNSFRIQWKDHNSSSSKQSSSPIQRPTTMPNIIGLAKIPQWSERDPAAFHSLPISKTGAPTYCRSSQPLESILKLQTHSMSRKWILV